MEYKLSLYQPVQVVYGDQRFTLRKLNRQMYRVLADFGAKERAAANDRFAMIEVVYDELQALVDAPADIINDLDQEQVLELKRIIDAVVFKRESTAVAEAGEEKNALRPGEDSTPS